MNTTFIFMPYEIILENSLFSITLGKKNINKEKDIVWRRTILFPKL
jgi:hypothetical protein